MCVRVRARACVYAFVSTTSPTHSLPHALPQGDIQSVEKTVKSNAALVKSVKNAQITGAPGPRGAPGLDGINGNNGAAGPEGPRGKEGPSGQVGYSDVRRVMCDV